MSKNITVILLIAVIIIYFFWYNAPEQKIKRNLKDLKKSVEKEKVDGILDKLSSSFNYYQYRKEDVWQDCEIFFDNYEKIKIEIKEINVKVEKEKGISVFGLRVTGRYGGYRYVLVGGIRELERVVFYWKKENKKWKIYDCDFPTLKHWIHIRPEKYKKLKKYIKV
ncbi:hypothetical protein NLC26_00675 [Candidatus Aminicenantes bacterium AC-708-M15]|jgi:hypothetical protein|nr:hypothetical protein [SCandidatus Aminicenantes bacterium Aminicenantia_JdfR_composite]MCP2596948.1 hypothetical protein [Candidatus Aminicenantes bacterium AC-335-G13]MCP2603974.1 hypothetical protein [Candidatus Aminicenantes bacterium AC-708-M15]MCP2621070.1 hypothetical protein [Candidatus Aminicenantes bacterium AC-334-E05]